MTTTPTTRLPGDPIPPPPEPRYPWRVGVTMLGLLVLVLTVVWLAFQVVKGPQTSSEFPSPATATAYARAFQATVAAADTAQPRPTGAPTAASAAQPTAAPTRAPAALPGPAGALAATPGLAATVPAAAAQPATTEAAVATSAPTPAATQAAAAAGQAEPARTATVATVGGDQSGIESPVPTVAPDLEQAISDAYLGKYWQAKADALYSLDPTSLQDVAAGPELTRLQQRIEDDKAQGHATLVKTKHTFAVSWAHDGEAQVVDRYADMSIWVDAITHESLPGQVEPSVDAAPIHKVIDNLQFIDGTWKVTDGVEVMDGEAAP